MITESRAVPSGAAVFLTASMRPRSDDHGKVGKIDQSGAEFHELQ